MEPKRRRGDELGASSASPRMPLDPPSWAGQGPMPLEASTCLIWEDTQMWQLLTKG